MFSLTVTVIARPLGLHYNHYVSLSFRYPITLEPNWIFCYIMEILQTYLF